MNAPNTPVNLGPQTIPYSRSGNDVYGSYELNFTAYNKVCYAVLNGTTTTTTTTTTAPSSSSSYSWSVWYGLNTGVLCPIETINGFTAYGNGEFLLYYDGNGYWTIDQEYPAGSEYRIVIASSEGSSSTPPLTGWSEGSLSTATNTCTSTTTTTTTTTTTAAPTTTTTTATPTTTTTTASPTNVYRSIPTMTSNTSPSGDVLYSNDVQNGYLSNGSSESYRWFRNSGNPGDDPNSNPVLAINAWIGYDFGNSLKSKIGGFTITKSSRYNDHYASEFLFQGSDDGSTWVTLLNPTGLTQTTWDSGPVSFQLNSQVEYRMYRWVITGAPNIYTEWVLVQFLDISPTTTTTTTTAAPSVPAYFVQSNAAWGGKYCEDGTLDGKKKYRKAGTNYHIYWGNASALSSWVIDTLENRFIQGATIYALGLNSNDEDVTPPVGMVWYNEDTGQDVSVFDVFYTMSVPITLLNTLIPYGSVYNGKPLYNSSGGGLLAQYETAWLIKDQEADPENPVVLYQNNSTANTLPLTGWTVVNGSSPAPTLIGPNC